MIKHFALIVLIVAGVALALLLFGKLGPVVYGLPRFCHRQSRKRAQDCTERPTGVTGTMVAL